jgi:hypothetical protein
MVGIWREEEIYLLFAQKKMSLKTGGAVSVETTPPEHSIFTLLHRN